MLVPATDDFGAALAAADLAISRAGGTVWELAAAGTPAILVPYPHATADHQTLNARHFEAGGGAVVVDQSELARVPALVDELLGDADRLARMSGAMQALARPDAADVVADELVALAESRSMSERPLAGRRFYFVGIGGAGLSAYANFARAWGAEVAGWDVRDTIFLEAVRDARVDVGGEPAPPVGFEVVVSTAHVGRIEGRSRAEFLAELVSLRRSIVVGGAHGKTTTTAMVAYVLRELGHDPAWIIGGVVPQLGGNAGVGEGWLVVEGDESDRSIELLRPEIAVVTNIELDHHATYASEAELAAFFERLARAGAAGGARLGARAGRPRAGRSRSTQSRQCRDGSRSARACRRGARRRGASDHGVHGRRAKVRARR